MSYSSGRNGLSYVLDRYINKKTTYCRRGNVYFDGDVMYSYASHFPMVVRKSASTNKKDGKEWYLLNGNKYSITTSRHQSATFSHEALKKQPRIAFDTLRAIPINPQSVSFELLDFAPDYNSQWEQEPTEWNKETGKYESTVQTQTFKEWRKAQPIGASVSVSKNEDGSTKLAHSHRIGVVLFRFPHTKETRGIPDHDLSSRVLGYRYFIAGMDEGSYFISELTKPVNTIDKALTALKPLAVRKAEAQGQEVLRQGDWFFIPLNGLGPKLANRLFKQGELPIKEFQRNRSHNVHMVRRFYKDSKAIYCRGTVYHRNVQGRRGNHRSLKLPDTCLAYQNTSIRDWSANGRVD